MENGQQASRCQRFQQMLPTKALSSLWLAFRKLAILRDSVLGSNRLFLAFSVVVVGMGLSFLMPGRSMSFGISHTNSKLFLRRDGDGHRGHKT